MCSYKQTFNFCFSSSIGNCLLHNNILIILHWWWYTTNHKCMQARVVVAASCIRAQNFVWKLNVLLLFEWKLSKLNSTLKVLLFTRKYKKDHIFWKTWKEISNKIILFIFCYGLSLQPNVFVLLLLLSMVVGFQTLRVQFYKKEACHQAEILSSYLEYVYLISIHVV